MIGSSCRHWFRPLSEATRDYEAAVQTGRNSGNLQYAAYAFGHNMYCRFFQGTSLDTLLSESQASLAFSRTRHNQWAIDLLEGGMRVFNDLAVEPSHREPNAKSANEYQCDVQSHQNQQVLCIYYVMLSQQCLFLGQLEEALEWSNRAEPLIDSVGTQGLLPWAEHVFARALILAGMRADPDREIRTADRELTELSNQLRVWADHCPENFSHKHLLVGAEIAHLAGRYVEASERYDEAIDQAQQNGFVQWEGVANERAARFWRERGNGRLEQIYWQRAYECFERWGAKAKLQLMTAKFRQELSQEVQQAIGNETYDSSDQQTNGERLLDRQMKLLHDHAEEISNAREQAQMVLTAAELASAADSLRVDLAAGRRTATELREQRDEEHRLNKELERRVKQRTAALERTANDLRHANTSLEQMEQRFRTTVESAPTAMVMIDKEGKIVLVNAETERLFGYSRDELLQQPIEKLVPERFRNNHPDKRKAFFADPSIRRMGAGHDLFGLRRDGVEIPIELGLNPVKTDEGMFVLSAIVDITERKQAEDKMRQANAALEQSNTELEQFAYVASHDLQEPLRKIASYCQLLKEEQADRLNDDGKHYLDVAINGAKRLQTLVRDLLTFSRITTRGKPLETTDASASFEDALANLSMTIEEGSAVVTADPLPLIVAETGQLTHLFQNLIGNALKYCNQSTPEVHVGVRDLGEQYEIFIEDNGIGIEPQFHERIFQVFQRLHNRREYSGTGIGLALCKRIVERFGGEISVKSDGTSGSTFLFTVNKPKQCEADFQEEQHDFKRHHAELGAAT